MKIAVCDDEISVANELAKIVEELCISMDMLYTIDVYSSGLKLADNVRDYDMVFLDINMDELDGIKVGRLVGLYNPDCLIIMATGEENRFKEAFEIGAKGFISKPFNPLEIKRAIKMAKIPERMNKTIDVYFNRVRASINIKNVKYCTAYNGYVLVYANGCEYRKDASLKEVDKYLKSRYFYRVNRNCIVNMKWIKRYSKGIIYIDDKEIVVSKKRMNDFYYLYSNFDSTNVT